MKKIMVIFVLAVLGCKSSVSPERSGEPEKFDLVAQNVQKIGETQDPKVNILFVVDNSGSMAAYQELLSKNIQQFANRFFRNQRIDYRIGVVPIFDERYLHSDQLNSAGQRRKMNPLGELVPLKGLPEGSTPDGSTPRFITRETPNAEAVLSQTVLLGAEKWGPEAEESFRPVLAIFDEKRNASINGGFYQKEAHLMIVFLTDADDVGLLSGEQFYQSLLEEKSGDASKILIATAFPDPRSTTCPQNSSSEKPIRDKFPSLLNASGGMMLDLCSPDFGYRLTLLGERLRQRIGRQVIELGFIPDLDTLNVYYGPAGSNKESDASSLQILDRTKGDFRISGTELIVSDDLSISKIVNGEIFVYAKPAALANYKNGRLNPGY
jgi:hypothetical protein